MNSSATRLHLDSKRHHAVWKHGANSHQVERLERAIGYLTMRMDRARHQRESCPTCGAYAFFGSASPETCPFCA